MRSVELRLVALLNVAAVVCLACLYAANAEEVQSGVPIELEFKGTGSTLIDYRHKGPPPWPDGNIASIGMRTIVNVHAENLWYLNANLPLDSVKVLPLRDNRLLVVDERIDRDWLTYRPKCGSFKYQIDLMNLHRDKFAEPPPAVAELFGWEWNLVLHRDVREWLSADVPKDYLTTLLPTDHIEFQAATVLLKNRQGETEAERPWLLVSIRRPCEITICGEDPESEGYYGVTFRMRRNADRLTLFPMSWHSEGGTSTTTLSTNGHSEQLLYKRGRRLP